MIEKEVDIEDTPMQMRRENERERTVRLIQLRRQIAD